MEERDRYKGNDALTAKQTLLLVTQRQVSPVCGKSHLKTQTAHEEQLDQRILTS